MNFKITVWLLELVRDVQLKKTHTNKLNQTRIKTKIAVFHDLTNFLLAFPPPHSFKCLLHFRVCITFMIGILHKIFMFIQENFASWRKLKRLTSGFERIPRTLSFWDIYVFPLSSQSLPHRTALGERERERGFGILITRKLGEIFNQVNGATTQS